MSTDPEQWAQSVDTEVPSAARMYDFYLGGSHNFAADREAARKVIAAIPAVPFIAQANRRFLARVVRYLMGVGIRQFLDIGSGIPTVGNVHEIAQQLDPQARVIYVDVDPIAVIHSQQLLAGNPNAVAVAGDLRQPQELLSTLSQPLYQAVLNFDEPVGLLLMAVLHFVPGEDAYTDVAVLCEALAPGSYLALSHSSVEGFQEMTSGQSDSAQREYSKTSTPAGLRTRPEIERFFDGTRLVDPGVVWAGQWHPDADAQDSSDQPQRTGMLAGVAEIGGQR